MAGLHHARLRGVVGAKVISGNNAHVNWSQLPEPLRSRAESWWGQRARVAARTDDAGEWRVVLLRSDELCWVGWSMVNFNG